MEQTIVKGRVLVKPEVQTEEQGAEEQVTEEEFRTLPDYVLAAALKYTDMVQGKPEHWFTLDEVEKHIYEEFGWK